MASIFLKRIRLKPARHDGTRVLLERRWPRGVGREATRVHAWLRELAPAPELRRWFAARPAQWSLFRRRYLAQLAEPTAAADLGRLYELAATRPRMTLLHDAADEEHSAAMVLKQLLEGMRKPPSSSGPSRSVAAAPARARARR